MKNILKHAVACLVLVAAVASCTKETTPERINIQHPDQQSPILRDNAYYQALRDGHHLDLEPVAHAHAPAEGR